MSVPADMKTSVAPVSILTSVSTDSPTATTTQTAPIEPAATNVHATRAMSDQAIFVKMSMSARRRLITAVPIHLVQICKEGSNASAMTALS